MLNKSIKINSIYARSINLERDDSKIDLLDSYIPTSVTLQNSCVSSSSLLIKPFSVILKIDPIVAVVPWSATGSRTCPMNHTVKTQSIWLWPTPRCFAFSIVHGKDWMFSCPQGETTVEGMQHKIHEARVRIRFCRYPERFRVSLCKDKWA